MEKGGAYENEDSQAASLNRKIQCIYCWSQHTLTDM